jgi:hypothetical protein
MAEPMPIDTLFYYNNTDSPEQAHGAHYPARSDKC